MACILAWSLCLRSSKLSVLVFISTALGDFLGFLGPVIYRLYHHKFSTFKYTENHIIYNIMLPKCTLWGVLMLGHESILQLWDRLDLSRIIPRPFALLSWYLLTLLLFLCGLFLWNLINCAQFIIICSLIFWIYCQRLLGNWLHTIGIDAG